ncbi:zinc metalloproteinase nas-13-like isoform X2 [Ischnura elegans]|uniref:zinc metalloproteinase nas-13-like isoform X2 n=1 Tax=Ischnura elegans TaxID=197161 RepID=UPI001ED89796|nr:zinc metalloproteinase nas-13-like isoform X2 [Ischnura elegans]
MKLVFPVLGSCTENHISRMCQLGSAYPLNDPATDDNNVSQGDRDIINLFSFGEKLFGRPNPEAGRKVREWTSDSVGLPEELGTYVEGDILHPQTLARNGMKHESFRWEGATIPYTISEAFDAQDRKTIQLAMDQFHKLTCIRFVPRKFARQKDYIHIEMDQTGCWSSVGRIGGRQVVNLQSPGCLTTVGTPIHELMHAVGFLHEQNRYERDNHVTIKWNNIQKGREINFEKASADTTDALGVPYDYRSVMHYSPYAFSVNKDPTIIPKVPNVDIGQRIGLSRKDVQKIYRMYKCEQYEKNIK